jgi:hypothetical protein
MKIRRCIETFRQPEIRNRLQNICLPLTVRSQQEVDAVTEPEKTVRMVPEVLQMNIENCHEYSSPVVDGAARDFEAIRRMRIAC